jgi:UDP-N-acetylglucosamine--N-acetylmuramyl-(pentapeptide) pyrophosphoryl-undecaprenol N-acetylglucosamine transferase
VAGDGRAASADLVRWVVARHDPGCGGADRQRRSQQTPIGRDAAGLKLVLTGGGTGGHIYPALAIAETLSHEAACSPLDILFVGTRDRLEAQIVPKAAVPIAYVHAAPLERSFSLSFLRTAAVNAVGFAEALRILHRMKPDVLIATGGYVAFPVVSALRLVRALGLSRARIALFEPNAVAGLTNRLLAPLVDEIWYASAPDARPLGVREHVVGTPVRSSLRRTMSASEGRAALGLDDAKTTIVVLGGSQGARSLNESAAQLAETGMPGDWQLLVVSGDADFASLHSRLRERAGVSVLAYLDDPRAAYAAADIVVARSGASTLAELAATATPALLVPYPYATGDHQMHNARAYAADGAARVLPDVELDGERLRTELEAMLSDVPALRRAAQRRAEADPRVAIVARVKTWPFANKHDP